MVTLFVITGVLTRSYRSERHERAERQYQAGQELARQGRYRGSISQYRQALALSRDNLRYRQALALALVELGRTTEAEMYLLELIGLDPANGIANLTLARIYTARGNIDSASQYYQRAIYGLWPEDPGGNRIKVRFELIEVLARERQNMQLKAELLRLTDEVPDDAGMKKRIGRLFLTAQSPDIAANMFQEVVDKDARDAEAFAGLGDAEFELGHYLSARTAYRQALHLRAEDLQSRLQMEVATEIINLDPMRRGLGSATRLQISRNLVKRSLSALDYCLPEDREALPEDFRQIVERADSLVSGKLRQRSTDEAVEANIELTEQLQQAGSTFCGASPVPDRALQLVLERLANR